MSRWLVVALLAALLGSAAGGSAGGAQEGAEIRIDAVDASAFPEITAVVTVLDSAGRPVVGIPAEAFQAVADGDSLPILSVADSRDDRLAIAVVLTFDVSGSMEGAALAQAKEAGKALVNELGPNDEVSLVSFADDVSVVQPFSRDRGGLAPAIDGLKAAGDTALYDGVIGSIDTAKQSALPRRAVVLLSDGLDFGGVSENDRAASIAAAQAAGIPMFLVGLGQSIDQPYLQELATAARGQLFLAPSPEQLRTLFQAIGSILRHQYVLTIDGSSIAPGSEPNLRIQVDHAGTTVAAETALTLPALAVTPAPTPTSATAAVTRQPSPSPALPEIVEEDGGTDVLPVAGGLVAAAAVAGIGGVLVMRVRRRRADGVEAEGDLRHAAGRGGQRMIFTGTGAPEEAPQPDASLQVLAPSPGPLHPLGDSPVEIGFTTDCNICLPAEGTHHWERVRVWRREGRYMLHNLSRMGSVTVAGRPAIWVVLEDGDEIQLGNCRLAFKQNIRLSMGEA